MQDLHVYPRIQLQTTAVACLPACCAHAMQRASHLFPCRCLLSIANVQQSACQASVRLLHGHQLSKTSPAWATVQHGRIAVGSPFGAGVESPHQTSMGRVPVSDTLRPGGSWLCCSEQGMRCRQDDFWFLNTCEELKRQFPCERGCAAELGPDVPNYVMSEELGTHHMCLVNQRQPLCSASHQSTARLCPCIPSLPVKQTP